MLEGLGARLASIRQTPSLHRPAGSLRQLTAVLVPAVVAEAVLLRLVTRVGVHLPKDGSVTALFEAASFLGSLAFNFASLLAIALAALVLGSVTQRMDNWASRVVVGFLSLAMLSGLALTLTTGSPLADALFGLAAVTLVGFIGLVLAREAGLSTGARTSLALMVFAYFCYQYYALSHLFYRIMDYGSLPPLSVEILRLGELLVVGAAVAAFWAWGLPRWSSVGRRGIAAVAAVLAALTLAALSPVSTTAILALWTTGLSLFLPFPIYLLALALYLLTLVACWRSGAPFATAAGLLLVLLAGYMAEATYQHLLLILGVALLSRAVPWAEPDDTPVFAAHSASPLRYPSEPAADHSRR